VRGDAGAVSDDEGTAGLATRRVGETSPALTAARKRAAIELIARDEGELRRTARRYSLCVEDAEDAYQRSLEILLLKAPNDRHRDLIRWTKTVVKHEALAIRRNRERLLGTAAAARAAEAMSDDPVAQIPAHGEGPAERAELQERVARSREALQALKPAELRSLTLLAAGYSYAEIGQITGFSQTKVNRCLAEGRERFRHIAAGSEDGSRCAEMGPLLSAFCDGEASAKDTRAVKEHLRACAGCRATMRAYRAAPAAVAALTPALPASRSLLDRAYELLGWLHARLPGGGGGAGDTGLTQVAMTGGTRGAGMAALAKALAICAGTVGGAACVATGVTPLPFELAPQQSNQATVERISARAIEETAPSATEPQQGAGEPVAKGESTAAPERKRPESRHDSAAAAEAGAVEYVAPPSQPAPAPLRPPRRKPRLRRLKLPPAAAPPGSSAHEEMRRGIVYGRRPAGSGGRRGGPIARRRDPTRSGEPAGRGR
jgi:RNA polymerase sigma factor (sigma-70 family)